MKPLIETFPVGPLQCNCTVVGDSVTGQAVVVDPGGDAPLILKTLQKLGLKTVTAVIHTHAHIDHVGATAEMCDVFHAPAFLHDDDVPLYDQLQVQAYMLGIEEPVKVDMRALVDGQEHKAGDISVGVMHTPGHTMGSCCFMLQRAGVLLSGDTLFKRGVGRTDLGGDWPMLVKTIKEQLFVLPDETVVIPGHGPVTTVGEERRLNPFMK